MLHELVSAVGSLSTPDQLVLGGAVVSVLVWAVKSLSFTEKYHTVIASFVLPAAVGSLVAVLGDRGPIQAGTDLYVASQALLWVVRGFLAVYNTQRTTATVQTAQF